MLESDPGRAHIPAADGDDWYKPDTHLQWLLRRHVGEAVWPVANGALSELGRLVPQRIEPLVRQADRNPPVLRQYDARGQRIDEIDFHPAYTEVENTVLGFGLVRAAHTPGWRGLRGLAPRALTTALFYQTVQSDQAITGCPIGMMDAMARCLERNDPGLAKRFVPGIADDTGQHLRSGMFLTEKAGGSDVGANETTAVRDEDGVWRLSGEKWFCSCPHSDLILVTARPQGAPAGPRGLGLFLMPRTLDNGDRNSFVIHRLKDKFGTRSMASGEVGLRGATAWQVGALDKGMSQMMDMVSLTRVSIAGAAAGAMRRNTWEALHHTASRQAFGMSLDRQPLMRDTLAEMVVDSTAGLTAALGISEMLDQADSGDRVAEAGLRMLTPLFKGYLTERARITATDGMEVRGGNGFIEDWPDPRILRDVYVHAIWEGSSNVIALDVLRAVGQGAGPGLLADIERHAEAASGSAGPASALCDVLLSYNQRLEMRLAALANTDPEAQQLPLRRLARHMAILAIGARLTDQANQFAANTGSGRLAWIAARFLARLGGEPAVAAVADDAAWLEHADAILNGGHVPLQVGEDAAKAAANAVGSAVAAVNT